MYKVLIVEKITYVSKLINGRDICLTLQTFMKSLANTNKPAEGTFITLESENSSWPFMSWIVTESQNHRMVGLGRDFCGSPSPTLLPKQGHLQQAAQDRVQAGLEYLQRWRLHNLPGQPVPVLRHPQREEVLPHVQVELPMLQFVPVAPCRVPHPPHTHPSDIYRHL